MLSFPGPWCLDGMAHNVGIRVGEALFEADIGDREEELDNVYDVHRNDVTQ